MREYAVPHDMSTEKDIILLQMKIKITKRKKFIQSLVI